MSTGYIIVKVDRQRHKRTPRLSLTSISGFAGADTEELKTESHKTEKYAVIISAVKFNISPPNQS
jgi:hypothetical protein